MFNGDDQCVGNMTSCGTESLLLTMKTYRDYRGKGDVIMSTAGHPGINKGCDYVGLNVVQIPIDENRQMSIPHLKKVISSKTVVVVASAPQYPHGVVDNIEEIGKICQKYGVPLHIDSAIGGYVLPFIEKLGKNKFGKWDFRVPAVTSINADIHKYGYSPKGSSVLVYRNSKIRRNQYFTFSTWPGGIYISPTALGSRNGGCLSSAWGSFLELGEEGFMKATSMILESVEKLCKFIKENDELELMAQPHSTIVSFRCKNISSYSFGDCMKKYGYAVEMQSNPECLHMSLMPQHCRLIDDILSVMEKSIKEIQSNPSLFDNDSKAVYGMLAKIPDEAVVEDFMVHYMDQIYKYKKN